MLFKERASLVLEHYRERIKDKSQTEEAMLYAKSFGEMAEIGWFYHGDINGPYCVNYPTCGHSRYRKCDMCGQKKYNWTKDGKGYYCLDCMYRVILVSNPTKKWLSKIQRHFLDTSSYNCVFLHDTRFPFADEEKRAMHVPVDNKYYSRFDRGHRLHQEVA